ncbi:hypothetical protein SGFS_047660 [Streptomyces graminofaciens]|uniref:Uncharacterized protein n=1 Tax=Streptomyces graminofaciens TaxID=68212 RepID=A0ABN5VJF2_9ACTN|nr:hypothetical protein SGFS_047660 [Streptomyces graminofaciens]
MLDTGPPGEPAETGEGLGVENEQRRWHRCGNRPSYASGMSSGTWPEMRRLPTLAPEPTVVNTELRTFCAASLSLRESGGGSRTPPRLPAHVLSANQVTDGGGTASGGYPGVGPYQALVDGRGCGPPVPPSVPPPVLPEEQEGCA